MKRSLIWIIVIAVLVFVFLIARPLYILQEEDQVVVARFGNIVRSHTGSGLKFKVPFLEQLTIYSRKVKVYDSSPDTALTSDKRRLNVDFFVAYYIDDPVLYKQKVRTTQNAQTRLDDILYSSLRNEISQHTFHENIREREMVTDKALETSSATLEEFGIHVVDIQIELLNLPEANQASVFERMRSERNRIAAEYESEGKAEAQKIRAQADRQAQEILADATRQSEEVKGAGDAERTNIYANAYSADEDFYEFWKALRTLETTIPETQTMLFMPIDSLLGQYLIGDIE